MQFCKGFLTFGIFCEELNQPYHDHIDVDLIVNWLYKTRMQNRIGIHHTSAKSKSNWFCPPRCSFDTISVYFYLCLPVSVGLQLGAEGEGGGGGQGGGLNTIIGSIVQAGSAAPGPELSSQLTPCQFWLDSVLCSLVTALALARHSRSPGKVYNNKMLNWIPPSPARAPPSQALILARVIEL